MPNEKGNTMKTKHQTREKAIPPRIAFHVAFLPDDLSPRQYREEVRRIVKECQKYPPEDALTPFILQVYDDELSEIIHEAIQDN